MPRVYERKPIPGLRCPKCGGRWIIKKGQARGTQRYQCKDCRDWHGARPIGLEVHDAGIDRTRADALYRSVREAEGVQRYVITAAQNATGVHKPFFETLKAYCRHVGANLLVIPYRYKNPTSQWSEKAKDDDWWAEELAPHLFDRRIRLNENLLLLADIKTQPTASDPLRGFETISGGMSAIIGHPKPELTTIPTPQNRLPKILTTTGAVTALNYIPSKAGKRAEHHHTLGACVVELDGQYFFLRRIVGQKDGSFCDLDYEYQGSSRRPIQAAALVMGDTHVRFIDPGVVQATFEGSGSMLSVLRPRHLVWHDFYDQHARSHHDRDKVFDAYVKHQNGKGNVERELDDAFAFVDKQSPEWTRNVFVRSNHPNEHLERWVNETDPRRDPENCVFWARTFEAMCMGARWTPSGSATIDPLKFWAERKLKCYRRSTFLGSDESFAVAGVDLSHHGHRGLNGARGTIRSFGRIGVRTIIGHGHSPGEKDGAMQTGTSSLLRLGYNEGPSSWLQAHAVLYPNGKRSLLFIIDGHWRAMGDRKRQRGESRVAGPVRRRAPATA